jgi:hypothetical protein
MRQSAGKTNKMLEKFGIVSLSLFNRQGQKLPVEEQILLLGTERNRLDVEIKRFREETLEPTKTEHRYFVALKDARKKIQIELRRIRRFERKKDDKELHEDLGIMTKQELKDWRVLSHKLNNIELNLSQIFEKLTELRAYSRFSGLLERLQMESDNLKKDISYYRLSVDEIENITTKHYYRDKVAADEERQRLHQQIEQQSSTTECVTAKAEVTV